jgi:hypothetical protein
LQYIAPTDIVQLAQVAANLRTEFTSLSDFFDNILEDFNQLPTVTFKVLLSTSKMPGPFQLAFCANLLLPMVSGTLPDYFRYEPTQEHFEKTYLTLKSTNQSYATNAKISLIVEQMVIYMVSQDAFTATDELRKAMEAGIEARHSVYGTGRGKKGNGEEESQSRAVMETCSERLLGVLELLEMAAGKALPPVQTTLPTFLSFGSGSSLSPAPESDDIAE